MGSRPMKIALSRSSLMGIRTIPALDISSGIESEMSNRSGPSCMATTFCPTGWATASVPTCFPRSPSAHKFQKVQFTHPLQQRLPANQKEKDKYKAIGAKVGARANRKLSPATQSSDRPFWGPFRRSHPQFDEHGSRFKCPPTSTLRGPARIRHMPLMWPLRSICFWLPFWRQMNVAVFLRVL